jgi:hypothetical protein
MKIRTGLEFKNGKCDAFKPIRIKRWDSGYSIKCMLGKGTIVVRPYNEDTLEHDLKSFCDNCKEGSTIKNCSECYMDGNCIHQENNDMCPLGVNPKKQKKEPKT